jgi:pimeloyl-ACP methyl ester carboxylesterase
MTTNDTLNQLFSADERQAIDLVRSASHDDLKAKFGEDASAVHTYAHHAAEGFNRVGKKGDSLIVLLPGLTGSSLADTARSSQSLIWFNPVALLQGRLNDLDLDADGVTDLNPNVHIEPVAAVWVAYAKMIFRLRADYDLLVLPYDWRRSVTHTALNLPALLDDALANSPFDSVTLVGHSMGGLVAFDYLTHPNTQAHAERRVKRCITLGAPFKGTLEALGSLANPDDPKFRAATLLNRSNDPHRMLLTFPSLYDLLPTPNDLYPDYQPAPQLDVYDPQTWFASGHHINPTHLEAARRRHVRVAEADPQVRLINVVGSHYKTRGTYEGDQISISQLMQEAALVRGDGTVDVRSAVFEGAEAYYLQEDHVEMALDRDIIRSVMRWAEGGDPVGLETDISRVQLDDEKLRSAQERTTADESVIAQKISRDQPLTHAELMAIVTPFRRGRVEGMPT